MHRFNQEINIGPRLTVAFLTVALLVFVSGLIGLVGFQRAARAADVLVADAEMIRQVQEIRVDVSRLLDPPKDFLFMGDPWASQRFRETAAAVRLCLDKYAAAHQTHQHTSTHVNSADTLIAQVGVDVERMAQIGASIFDTESTAEGQSYLVQLEAIAVESAYRLDQVLAAAEEDIESANNIHAAAERSAYIGLSTSALLAVGIALALAFTFARSISVPLAQLAEAADRIASGDLSSPVSVEASGELSRLANAFEGMRRTLIRERGRARLLAVLEERDRIGREMHDGLAQVLGYVNTKAQAVGEYLKSGEPHIAERHIDELVAAAREAYTDAREVIVGLRMDNVGQRPLAEMLDEYVAQFVRRNEIAAVLKVAPDWNDSLLLAADQVQLLRVVQEALTNVRKHAAASQVSIDLSVELGQAVIRVTDDGRGFNLSSLLRPDYARYGLRTMRERVQAVGGKFRIESAVGRGTSIIVRVPLNSQDQEQLL